MPVDYHRGWSDDRQIAARPPARGTVEILLEVGLIFALVLAAIFLSAKLLRVPLSAGRLLAVAGAGLVALAIADVIASAVASGEPTELLLREVILALAVAPIVSRAAVVSSGKGLAVGAAAGLIRLLLGVLVEALVSLFLFGGHL